MAYLQSVKIAMAYIQLTLLLMADIEKTYSFSDTG
jgi:hypothetical protein